MNISIFNRDYLVRRYDEDGLTYTESTESLHIHESEQDSGQPWNETMGIVRRLEGHGMVELHVADMETGTKGDRLYYHGRWYECTAAVLYEHTLLGHWNYRFIVVPEDAVTTITLFNAAVDHETGYDLYIPTIIRGVSWLYDK